MSAILHSMSYRQSLCFLASMAFELSIPYCVHCSARVGSCGRSPILGNPIMQVPGIAVCN
jgi:hypothetical protein